MFDRYDAQARRVVVRAYEDARARRNHHIDTVHLLLGLLQDRDGAGARTLQRMGVDLHRLRGLMEQAAGAAPAATGDPAVRIPLTAQAEKVLALTLREADHLGHHVVGSDHLLLGLVRQREGAAGRQLRALGADLPHVRRQVLLARRPSPSRLD